MKPPSALASHRSHGDFALAVLEYTKLIFLGGQNEQLYVERARSFAELFDLCSCAANARRAIDVTATSSSSSSSSSSSLPSNERKKEQQGIKTFFAATTDALGSLLLERHIGLRRRGFRWRNIGDVNGTDDEKPRTSAAAAAIAAAKSCFDAAATFDTLVAGYWVHRALADVHANNWRGALSNAEHCLLLSETNAEVFVLRARLHWKLRLPTLRQAFKAACDATPAHPEVVLFESMQREETERQYRRASNCLLTSKFLDAVQLLTDALELNPADVKLLVMRASAYRQMGAYNNAQSDIVRLFSFCLASLRLFVIITVPRVALRYVASAYVHSCLLVCFCLLFYSRFGRRRYSNRAGRAGQCALAMCPNKLGWATRQCAVVNAAGSFTRCGSYGHVPQSCTNATYCLMTSRFHFTGRVNTMKPPCCLLKSLLPNRTHRSIAIRVIT